MKIHASLNKAVTLLKQSYPCLLLVTFFILLLPFTSATLTCEGDGQAFFMPEQIKDRTISIPCTLSSTPPFNASCVGSLYFQGDLISTYPAIEDVGLFGKTPYVEISSNNVAESFTIEWSNRDLLSYTTFEWEVWCSEMSGNIHSDSGTLTTEYPFTEPILDKSLTFFQRDNGLLLGGFFTLLILGVLVIVLIKVAT